MRQIANKQVGKDMGGSQRGEEGERKGKREGGKSQRAIFPIKTNNQSNRVEAVLQRGAATVAK